MASDAAPLICHASIANADEQVSLTTPVRQVRVTNTHATQTITCKAFTGTTAAAALAAATAATAAAAADDFFAVLPAAAATVHGASKVVFKSSKRTYVALAIIGSGAATTCIVEGTEWQD